MVGGRRSWFGGRRLRLLFDDSTRVQNQVANVFALPPALQEAAIEQSNKMDIVLAIGVLGVVAPHEAEDGTLYAAFRVC